MMEWVNRVGIVLEFLSFWLAAPEILGEERLRALERVLERGIRALPLTVLMVLRLTGLALVVMAFVVAMGGGWKAVVLVMVGWILVTVVLSMLMRGWRLKPVEVGVVVSSFVIVLAVVAAMLLNWEETLLWWKVLIVLGLLIMVVAGTGFMLKSLDKTVAPLLQVLADDKRIRQRSLAVGAVLFVVGFLLQLVATF